MALSAWVVEPCASFARVHEAMPLPSEDTLRFIATRYAQLRAANGKAFASAALVLPTADFFPDEFSQTPQGIASLLKRTLSYAPLAEDIDLELAFLEPPESGVAGAGGGCSSGACGPDGTSEAAQLGHATGLEDGGDCGYGGVTDVRKPPPPPPSPPRRAGGLVFSRTGEESGRGEG